MLGRKPQRNQFAANPAFEKDFNLLENFSTVCINKCFLQEDIEKDLAHEEKICLGKCLDRGYEYLRMVENSKK